MSEQLHAQASGESEERVVQVDFTLSIGEGRFDASVVVPAGQTTLTQILPAIQDLTSNIVDAAIQIVQSEGRQISCKAGCGACCRQLVPLSIFEAEALGEWILTLPEEHQEKLRLRFQAALLALRERDILERMNPEVWVDGSEEARALAVDYLAAKVACPFLVEESCGIHAVRPLICREYLVTSPPEFCAYPTVDTVAGVPMPIKPSGSLFRLGAQTEKGGRGWIPLVFLSAWMECGAQPGRRTSGTGPEVLYEFVRNLSS